jgi:uncharacterized protein YbaR (Trm112 family)/SAM-dependent methyltransferase
MKEPLLEVLACPDCGQGLRLRGETRRGDEILAGGLECAGCAASFEIRAGVPCLLPPSGEANRTRLGFTEQWTLQQGGQLERETSYGQDPYRRAELLSEVRTGPRLAAGDWILDAGCGPGDVTYALAAQNPQAHVVGLDFCDTLYAAARRAEDYPNLSFVHGDLMRPPFKPSLFCGLYSWGVLHHTPDTRAAFQTTAALVARDGALSVWIYPHPSESLMVVRSLYALRDLVFFGRGHLLPGRQRFRLAQAASLLFLPLFVAAFALDGLSMRRRLGRQRFGEVVGSFQVVNRGPGAFYRHLVFLVFDSVTPEYQFRHRRAEVVQWFDENGFGQVQTHDAVQGYYWGQCLEEGSGP